MVVFTDSVCGNFYSFFQFSFVVVFTALFVVVFTVLFVVVSSFCL